MNLSVSYPLAGRPFFFFSTACFRRRARSVRGQERTRAVDERIIREITPIFDTAPSCTVDAGRRQVDTENRTGSARDHQLAHRVPPTPADHEFNLWFTIALLRDASRPTGHRWLPAKPHRADESIRQLPTLRSSNDQHEHGMEGGKRGDSSAAVEAAPPRERERQPYTRPTRRDPARPGAMESTPIALDAAAAEVGVLAWTRTVPGSLRGMSTALIRAGWRRPLPPRAGSRRTGWASGRVQGGHHGVARMAASAASACTSATTPTGPTASHVDHGPLEGGVPTRSSTEDRRRA